MDFEQDEDEFSMSSYDGEQGDSLVIKPPQAVVQKKEKRDKRERKDRHRHKSERHKERHKSHREHRDQEERREHRRHRDSSRHEGRKHEKHRDKSSKREKRSDDLRNKLDKDRKMLERDQEHRRQERDNVYVDERGFEVRSRDHSSSSRHKKHDDRDLFEVVEDIELSPREKTEKDKRMQRFLLAEKQKELSEREAETRRQKREEEKKEEKRIEELRQRAEASMYRRGKRSSESPTQEIIKRTKFSLSAELPETVELISDDEMNESGELVEEEEPENLDFEDEQHEERESSEDTEGNSATDTDSSSETTTDDEGPIDEQESKNEPETHGSEEKVYKTHSRSVTPSGSSSGDTSEEKEKPSEPEEVEPIIISPVKSPVKEIKEILPPYYPAIMGCRSVDEFECLNRIEEGTYGVVYRAREKTSDEIVALKRLKMEKEKEGFPITSLREVNTLLKGQHENIVTVREIVVGSNMDKIYIVMDYVEHDLKSLMETMRAKKQLFTMGEVKTLMIQLMRAVHHLHDNWILHRDLKTSNLLLSHRGILKVGDFGLAREYGSPLKQYTPIVVTLWYRAPELLLGTKQYSCPIDVWSVGCIFGELLGMEPMFPGKSEIDQLNKIFKDLGSPSEKIWPGYSQLPVVKKTTFAEYPYNHLRERFKTRLSDEGFTLLNRFLTYNPTKRISCADGLKHPYFHHEAPAPIDPAMFPTWPAKSENPHGRVNKKSSPKPPSGGKNFKDLGNGDDESIAGFFLGGMPQGPGFQLKF